MWYICSMEYYLAIKRIELVITQQHGWTQTMLSERWKTKRKSTYLWFCWYKAPENTNEPVVTKRQWLGKGTQWEKKGAQENRSDIWCANCIVTSVQFRSVTQPCPTLWDPMDCSTPGFPVLHQLQSLLKFMSIKSVMPSNHLTLCHSLLPPSIFPSIRIFSNESVLPIRWPKYWSFSFTISSSNEYSGLISFRMDWVDLLAVQLSGVFSNTIVQKHQFFGTQLSL